MLVELQVFAPQLGIGLVRLTTLVVELKQL